MCKISVEIFCSLELEFSELTIVSRGLVVWFVSGSGSRDELSGTISSAMRDVIFIVESGEEDMILLSLTSSVVTISSCTFTSNTCSCLFVCWSVCILDNHDNGSTYQSRTYQSVRYYLIIGEGSQISTYQNRESTVFSLLIG